MGSKTDKRVEFRVFLWCCEFAPRSYILGTQFIRLKFYYYGHKYVEHLQLLPLFSTLTTGEYWTGKGKAATEKTVKVLPSPNEENGDTGDYDNNTTDQNYHRYNVEMGRVRWGRDLK